MLKAKILASLKTKYKNLGLSDKVLEGIADMLAATTTEEANIETAVSGVEPLLKTFQSDADTRVTAAVTKAKAEAAKPDPAAPAPTPAPAPDPAAPVKKEDDMPSWAKSILDTNKLLTEKITAIESGNIAKSRQQILDEKLAKANPLLKSTIQKAFSRMKFESDEDFNAYMAEVEADMGEQQQTETVEQIKGLGIPFGGNSKVKDTEVSPVMKDYITQRTAAAKAATPAT